MKHREVRPTNLKRGRPAGLESDGITSELSESAKFSDPPGFHPTRRRPVLISDIRNHVPTLKGPRVQRMRAVETLLDRGFPYSRKLNAHTSCVNALAFSSLDGRFLASGGDDLNIHLWDLHEERVSKPCYTFQGPRENIFVLSFSAHNRFIFSGGADDTVLKFDASTLERINTQVPRSPGAIFRQHDDSIRGIAPHPVQDDIFITGSEDGCLILHDCRIGPRTSDQDTIQLTAEVTGVEFHPVMEHVFATSDQRGNVCLRDTRMAFGPLFQRTQEGVVQTYNTKLSRRGIQHLSNPETSSISFNRQGTQLGVTMLNYFPTIYSLSDADPVAVCSASNLPDGTPVPPGERTYANACTMKHGSFGGPGLDTDALYAAGSDDFRAYIWSLPSPASLAAQRKIIPYAEWEAGEHAGVTAFAERATGPRCIPAQLHTPRARLGGHSSIVNTVLVHPHMLLAASAGIEAEVVLHGAVDSLLGGMKRTPARVRKIGEAWGAEPLEVEEDDEGQEGSEDGWDVERVADDQGRTIRLFDGLLRAESGIDVFAVRRWYTHGGDRAGVVGMDNDGQGDSDSEDDEDKSSESEVDEDDDVDMENV